MSATTNTPKKALCEARTSADAAYVKLIRGILIYGEELETRNHKVKSRIDAQDITFDGTPLVTLRPTAWKLALREMEWFLSGDPTCPEELRGWWSGQLSPLDTYQDGYGQQFRGSKYVDNAFEIASFDQIEFLMRALRTNPNSRRLILTAWNPGEMAQITETNENPNTPTTCHTTCAQFFVRQGKLHMRTYQRSADVLLGVPHNWIQSWALLQFLAYHSGLDVGTMRWSFGDVHLYQEDTHRGVAYRILSYAGDHVDMYDITKELRLVYNYSGEVDYSDLPKFKAADFTLEGSIPEPATKTRPTLL